MAAQLADVVDAGQTAGQIAARGGDKSKPRIAGVARLVELGVDDRRLAEAPTLRATLNTEAKIDTLIGDANDAQRLGRAPACIQSSSIFNGGAGIATRLSTYARATPPLLATSTYSPLPQETGVRDE